jgi:predicted DNA-binding protein with PD1-like motif
MENVVCAVGTSGKTIIGRVLPGHDFIQGMEDAFRQSGLTSGNLVSCVGSLRKTSFIFIKSKPGGLLGAGYDAPTILEGPLELLCLQGPLLMDEGEVFFHFHGVVADQNGRAWGGHFYKDNALMPDGQRLPGGNPVLATVDFTILGHEGAVIVRRMDTGMGMKVMMPEQAGGDL